MHIHKLTTQHTEFFTTDRKDPITGDNFQEGDEIVLCASCKSAFLRDSWEYMGGMHCNQAFTLEKLPLQTHIVSTIHELHFSKQLPHKKYGSIPRDLRSEVWKKSSFNDSLFAFFFTFTPLGIFIVSILGGLIIVALLVNKIIEPDMLIWVLAIGVSAYFLIAYLYIEYNRDSLTTFHKQLKGEEFYISNNGVGFYDALAMKDYFLPLKNILKITYKEESTFWIETTKVSIFYTHTDNVNTYACTCLLSLDSASLQNFLKALHQLKRKQDFDVELKLKDFTQRKIVLTLNQELNTNFLLKE